MSEPQPTTDRLTFAFLPRLKHLLPKNRGIPGIDYYQIPVTFMRQARELGLREIDNTEVYTITGPAGSVDCKLYGSGKPIPGLFANSGRRRCYIHEGIEAATGLSTEGTADVQKEEVKPSPSTAAGNSKDKA